MRHAAPFEPNPAREIGVYVHFPWCLRKCGYCDFASEAIRREAIPHAAYADAVLAELASHAAHLAAHLAEHPPATAGGVARARAPAGTIGGAGGLRVASVYFGGGTPSLWEPAELARVLAGISATFDRATDVEVTIECNPTSVDARRAEAWLRLGVNRASIGVQGLDPARLALLERLHDPAAAVAAVRAVAAAGFPRIGADLIFGLPDEPPEAAAAEARALAALPLTHVSAYALTLEPGTPLGDRARAGRVPLVSEDAVADSFLAVSEALAAEGFEHYEVSNHARDGHRSRHNLGYWRGRDYLGLGCGAWGTLNDAHGRLRYRNTPSPTQYLAGWTAPPSAARHEAAAPPAWPMVFPGAVVEQESIDAHTAFRERLMLGLRLAEGLDVAAAATELGVEPPAPSRTRALARLVAQARLVVEGDRWRIPRSAWLLADGTIAALL